jgi:uncharacterized RDD family membrane protein YckC
MFCSKCGANVPAGAAVCAACGQAVGGVAVPVYAAPMLPLVVYAGFWLRFVAWIIDRVLLGVVTRVVLFPFFGFSAMRMILHGHPNPEDLAPLIGTFERLFAVGFVLDWLYYALMESSVWQATLGKKTLGLRVTDLQGNRISFGRASGRFFGRIISGLTLLIGYIMAGFTEKKQALHDMIAGCLVIRQE